MFAAISQARMELNSQLKSDLNFGCVLSKLFSREFIISMNKHLIKMQKI
jgi:hypothetical protein